MKLLSKIKNSTFTTSLLKGIFSTLSIFPKDKRLIMFESFNGRQCSDNPRAIYEYLKVHYPHYKLVWCADKRFLDQFKEKDITYVPRFSLKWLWMMPRASYWVTNSRFPLWFPKSKNTVYLQTWHGTPLKKLGVDIEDVKLPDTTTEVYKQEFVYEASKWDYLISPNSYSSDIFKRAFGFTGNVIESGYPRNDFLVQNQNRETVEQLKKKANIPLDKKVILYAPTWRDNNFYDKGKYKFDIQMDLEKMRKSLGEEYIVLLRLHYLVSEHINLSKYAGFVYDFSKYEDIRDLYLLSDVLITDYSSVFFDFSILEKPILFYTYDLEEYRDELRGFYFDFETHAPGPLLQTTEEIIHHIQHIEEVEETYRSIRKEFKQQFSSLEDGNATARVVDEVFNNR